MVTEVFVVGVQKGAILIAVISSLCFCGSRDAFSETCTFDALSLSKKKIMSKLNAICSSEYNHHISYSKFPKILDAMFKDAAAELAMECLRSCRSYETRDDCAQRYANGAADAFIDARRTERIGNESMLKRICTSPDTTE
jgi:hypothetical protein